MTQRTLHGLFAATVARNGGAVALKAGSRRVTYAELDEWSNGIAAQIAARAVPATAGETPVIGLYLPRGVEAVVGVLAILKAGCAWVSLDPAYPEERLRFMLQDSGAALVLTLGRLSGDAAALSGGAADAVLIDAAVQEGGIPATLVDRLHDESRPAYVLYTSGSTGLPKGVVGSHAAILSRFAWMWQAFPFADDELCCSKTALNFADSIWEMLGGLIRGVPSVIADDATAKDPLLLLELLARERVSRLVVVPSLLAALLEAARASGASLPHLRYLTSSGELLPSELARQAGELGENLTLLNLYGSSEMAADATCCVVTPAVLDGKIVPVGTAIGDMRVVVVDDDLREVPAGTPGELCVSGPGLAIGYLGRPDLTEEKFMSNPFAASDDAVHARLFRSGDIVSLRPDGNLDYIGRKDFQIKIRGFRIEPGEVETTLATHPAIRACAVAAIENDGVRQLAAFCVGPGVNAATAAALRAFLLGKLPEYMVPSRFIGIEALPLLPNGKLDRHRLVAPDASHAVAGGDEDAATGTGAERLLHAVWTDVLRQSPIGLDDEFFAIGGDSIQAFRVVAAARLRGLLFTPAELHENPTIRGLAAIARQAGADGGKVRPASHDPSPGGPVPLSPMQQYYFGWAKPNPDKFNVGFIARLRELPDVDCLTDALRALVDHHDALRLRFRKDVSGRIVQQHVPHEEACRVPLQTFALPAAGEAQQLDALRARIAQLHDTLDIADGPVMTLALFEDPAGANHHLFLTMHELVTDALSLQIVLQDLRSAYFARLRGQPVALPPATTPYHEWVEKVRAYALSPDTQRQFDYWLEMRQAQPFPEDTPTAAAIQSDIDSYGFEVLGREQVAAVRRRFGAAAQQALIHAVVGGLAVTANRMSGQTDLIFHKVAHGREAAIPDADPSRTVGWFITHTPITVRLPEGGADDLGAVLEATAGQYRRIPDNGIGHSALRYFSPDPRAQVLAREDKVLTLFQFIGDIWQDNYDGELFLPTHPSLMDVPDTVAAENLADYHLHVYAYLAEGCFRMKFFYTRPNYRPETIVRMAGLFTDAVTGMLLQKG